MSDAPQPESNSRRVDRRTALQWMAAASVAVPQFGTDAFGAAAPGGKGYGPDPDLLKAYQPGDLWPLTFSKKQRALVAVLSDIIMPADETSPAASELGVPDFVDEWISSPYPAQQGDRAKILKGFDWMNEEAVRRGAKDFVLLPSETQLEICQELSITAKKDRSDFAGSFFRKLRDLVAGGYYTTPEGMRDIGFRGNVAMAEWNGPPAEVLEMLGLEAQEG